MHNPKNFRRPPGPVARFLSRVALRLMGWRTAGEPLQIPKYVLIAAPHTTNMDLFYMLFTTMTLHIPATWMMKDTAFWWPVGILWRKLGGLPVNRRAATNVVQQVVDTFNSRESLALVIAPEGTRKKVDHWKLGFYWMALDAKVPVVAGFINHETKTIGVSGPIDLTGDIETDFEALRVVFQEKAGIYPDYNKVQAARQIERREREASQDANTTPRAASGT